MTQDAGGRNEAQAKLWPLIKEIRVAMLTSWDGERMHARPMQGHQEAFQAKLYFFTRLDSGKTDEIQRFDQVNLAYADPDAQTYVSIAGRAKVSIDRELMKRYWNPMASAWLPNGLDDPELALIEVEAESAQYWDMTASRMRYLLEVARANLSSREPDLGDNAKLDLAARPAS